MNASRDKRGAAWSAVLAIAFSLSVGCQSTLTNPIGPTHSDVTTVAAATSAEPEPTTVTSRAHETVTGATSVAPSGVGEPSWTTMAVPPGVDRVAPTSEGLTAVGKYVRDTRVL